MLFLWTYCPLCRKSLQAYEIVIMQRASIVPFDPAQGRRGLLKKTGGFH